ncbi:MAG: glycosyltransferase [Phycisphaerae bacterium]|nr:glycosyltransferase [Phycisphaerae bacterium]
MTRILHVVDGRGVENELAALSELIHRSTAAGACAGVACVEPSARRRLAARLGRRVVGLESRFGQSVVASIRLHALCRRDAVNIVHAWGPRALASAAAIAPAARLIVTQTDPATVAETARWWRQVERPPAVAATSQIVRHGLASRGVAPERIVVIRGPIDFGAINDARRRDIRRELVGDAGPVLLTSGPARREDGQQAVIWAAAILQQLYPSIRAILPFESRETDRLGRMLRGIGLPQMLVAPRDRFTWAELAAAADVMVVAPSDEMATEPLAWAMAARVLVVGPARRSIAELIADHHNGLLTKSAAPRVLASLLLRGLQDEALRQRLVDTARSQAFEVFGARSFVDNYARLYENVAAGRRVDDGVRDTAMVA